MGESTGMLMQSTAVDLPLMTGHLSGITLKRQTPKSLLTPRGRPPPDKATAAEVSKPTRKLSLDPLWYPYFPEPIPP
ncbi:hypothetical protein IFR04_015625, partial [Cadophora malorum]